MKTKSVKKRQAHMQGALRFLIKAITSVNAAWVMDVLV